LVGHGVHAQGAEAVGYGKSDGWRVEAGFGTCERRRSMGSRALWAAGAQRLGKMVGIGNWAAAAAGAADRA
jgi:hypothetical protein